MASDNEMVAFENNLGKLGEMWRGLALRWAWRIPGEVENPPINLFWVSCETDETQKHQETQSRSYGARCTHRAIGEQAHVEFEKVFDKSREFVGRFGSLIGHVGLS